MRIAMLVADGGDGSTSIRFFKNVDLANKVADDDRYCEEFGTNEGSATVIEVGDDFRPPWGWDDAHYSGDFEDDE